MKKRTPEEYVESSLAWSQKRRKDLIPQFKELRKQVMNPSRITSAHLLKNFNHPSSPVAEAVMEVFALLLPTEAELCAQLFALFPTTSAKARARILIATKFLPEVAISQLLNQALTDKSSHVRYTATECILKRQLVGFLETLVNLSRTEPDAELRQYFLSVATPGLRQGFAVESVEDGYKLYVFHAGTAHMRFTGGPVPSDQQIRKQVAEIQSIMA